METEQEKQSVAGWTVRDMRHHSTAKLVVGLLAIGAGIIFLLDQQGIVKAYTLWRFWPLAFYVVGISKLFERDVPDRVMASGTMFLAGTAFLLINFGYVRWGQIWPACLIVFGLLLLWQAFRPREGRAPSVGPLNPYAVFSSVEKQVMDTDFSGGQINAVFGSVELDLTRAEMQGNTANIDLSTVFGSIEMRVPDTWAVKVEANAVFGSCENKARPPLPGANPRTLVLRGDVIFGSVEIRN